MCSTLLSLRTTLIKLHSSFASLASRYLAASSIHANVSSISGPEVGTSAITDVFKTLSTSDTKH